MKKRKHKTSQQYQQKIASAHHKNEFFMKMKNMFKTLGIPHVYNLIPPMDREFLYYFRKQSMRVVAAPENNIPQIIINDTKVIFSTIIKEHYIPIIDDESIKINLYDYCTIFLTIVAYSQLTENTRNPNMAEIALAMSPFVKYIEKEDKAGQILISVMHVFSFFESDLQHNVYWTKDETLDEYEGKSGSFAFLYIYGHSPEKKNITIDGSSRPVVRVGWGFPEATSFTYVNILPSQLKHKLKTDVDDFKVYIQSHAIQRISERLDCLRTGFAHFNIYASLFNAKEIMQDRHGRLLIEMYIFDAKVGYLVADIFGKDIVILSFLFLTNDGTPEGEKLKALTGLSKEDSKYLEIGKLSTFINSDIDKNERIKKIFIEAGCESLFLIDKSLNKDNSNSTKSKAEFIMQYLGLNTDNVNCNEYADNAELES